MPETRPTPRQIFNSLTSEDISATGLLRQIADWLRPGPDESIEAVCQRIDLLEKALSENQDASDTIARILQDWLGTANYFLAFAVLGLFPRQGFLRELGRRIYEHINPSPLNPDSLSDALTLIFHNKTDPQWVNELPHESWMKLFRILWNAKSGDAPRLLWKTISELLYALEMLSIWVAGEELEADLVRLEPRIVSRDSAFVALQREVSRYCRCYDAWISGEKSTLEDDAHARVLLAQCMDAVRAFRKKSVTKGTSIPLSYLLERLDQTLKRIEDILNLLDPKDPVSARQTAIPLFKELVTASRKRRSVRALFQRNVKLLSRSITENTSDHGEHYITGNRKEYLAMLRSGAGGGIIIALMALIKILIMDMALNPFPETILVSLNYGLGFMLIHILHFTVATKQPAMTAARLAEAVQQGEHGGANPKMIADLLIRVCRSQFIAIVGNVSVALSLAFGIGWAFNFFWGIPVLSQQASEYQIYELKPFESLALLHACIAGVWLFLAGLTAGFFDNRAAYIGLSARLKNHPLLRRLLPSAGAREKFADYMHKNYGSLMGNFFFGILLGSTAYIGLLLGLPLGIRHVAFASGNLGYAMSFSFPGLPLFCLYFLFVCLISFCNLWVSFGLALSVALKARDTKIKSFPKVLSALGQQVKAAPFSLLFPPADTIKKEPEKTEKPLNGQTKEQEKNQTG
ncbi:site-specific recombinase [Desulfobotulus mexicanus]|uniref:Recombinase n=1 Tax=Desulfobotulus mexicanus TaxID=2586642 RepID=A0A5Q4VDJ5_9BACT|nr:site-specific recombinase [Desulfobotulus mexicanus]TYT75774.1 recombinase [Desulfobotulus mexicanus]